MDKTVGNRIERLAADKGLPTHAELAKLIGVSYETLRKWRTGASAPNRKRQERLSELLSVSPDVFMHGSAGAKTVEPLPTAPPTTSLAEALEVLGIELAREMPNDVRDDLADALAKLVKRRGAERDQKQVLALLTTAPGKRSTST